MKRMVFSSANGLFQAGHHFEARWSVDLLFPDHYLTLYFLFSALLFAEPKGSCPTETTSFPQTRKAL